MKPISVCCGRPYGHLPGRDFLDVTVSITVDRSYWTVEILEECGTGGNYDCRATRVLGIGADLASAVENAREYARDAGVDMQYLAQALSQAAAQAARDTPGHWR